jgi:pimeloyl-ACP methyl ester carboxylesterase
VPQLRPVAGEEEKPMKKRLLACGVATAALGAVLVPVATGAGQAAEKVPARPSVDWAPCEATPAAECGTLRVPLDWSRPAGRQISVAVARRPADDPAHRIGVLFYNPGGPGDGAVDDVTEGAVATFSPELRARFDLVGMDPRGVGRSTPVQCTVPIVTPQDTLFPRTEEQYDALVRHNREVGRSCLHDTGALLGHLDTVSVARDHDALRQALHEPQVSWLGLSYGSQLGANYAQLFPRRTRAMVLDAALEHSQPEGKQVADEMLANEDSFNRFADWCDTAPDCALRGQDVRSVFDRLVADADRTPIPVDGALRAVTGEDIRRETMGKLRLRERADFAPGISWPDLSDALQQALKGNAPAFALPPADVMQGQLASQLGNACGDYVPQVDSWEEMQQRIQLGRQLAPHLQGASETWQVNRCIGWPVPVANPPRTLDVRGVPTLIVHAVHDPSLSYTWAHTLAAQIHGSSILTRTGDGHTSYHTSPCAQSATDRFLVVPSAPADSVCEE